MSTAAIAPPHTGAADSADGAVRLRVINRVAVITLDRPAALNALSHTMVRELAALLANVHDDRAIVAAVLCGAGDKGFCAGGDVRALYRMKTRGETGWLDFFIDEYRLYYALRRFPKPLVALLDGVSMGGGMGLGQAATLRVVTGRTKIAMPETRIGFVPDVGATYFLGVLPVELALYVGLTGATLSGADALQLKLADLCVPSDWLASFEERLLRMPTGGDLEAALRAVFEPPGNVVPHAAIGSYGQLISRHFDPRSNVVRMRATLHEALERAPPRAQRQWLEATCAALAAHSPTMLHVTREALLRGRRMTLADCFRMELGIAARAIGEGDFCEGVRAHLVDKDHCPRWMPATLADVGSDRVRRFLASPWPRDAHPLADLGARAAERRAPRAQSSRFSWTADAPSRQ
jgi:enoyl-CoA hydratase/carnithine racemase